MLYKKVIVINYNVYDTTVLELTCEHDVFCSVNYIRSQIISGITSWNFFLITEKIVIVILNYLSYRLE